jgi:8-oxo-dGTP diphosphatase
MRAPPSTRPIRVVAAVISRGGKYLITQRRPTAVLPMLWEFPGGRVEANESDSDALVREVSHRLGVDIVAGNMISYVSHPYERYTVELYLYECSIVRGDPIEQNVFAFRWVTSDEFDRYPFTPADEASVSKLLGVE